jgi:spermidine synthase
MREHQNHFDVIITDSSDPVRLTTALVADIHLAHVADIHWLSRCGYSPGFHSYS